MKITTNLYALGVALLVIAGFSSQSVAAQQCVFDDVVIEYDFQQARVDGCEQRDDGTIVIMTAPEDQPINPSPWYAFKASSDATQTVSFEVLALEKGRARYNPKASHDKQNWDDIPHYKEDHSIFFELEVGSEPQWVAGQELFNNDDYVTWLDELAQAHSLERFVIGTSAQGRELPAAVSRGQSDEWLILVGRQHPPEMTGAMALRSFVEAMFEQDNDFTARYNVLIAPNLNPDGVALGNWRHSTGGGDLNRDWFARSQPETSAIHNYLQELVANDQALVYGVDFHSTWRNVYYTMPADYLQNEPTFSQDWLAQLGTVVPYAVDEEPSTSERGIFKQYMADEYGIHSVTYEVGDETDRSEIAETAAAAAKVLTDYMMRR